MTVAAESLPTIVDACTPAGDWRTRSLDRAPFLVACADARRCSSSIYGSLQTGVFTLDELNLDTAAAMTLLLAATGQTIVLLRGGIDLSIGGMIRLGTVIAATQFGDDPVDRRCLVAADPGARLLRRRAQRPADLGAGLQPFLVTLATWSILSGAAMLILPTDGGSVPGWWIGFGYMQLPRPCQPGLAAAGALPLLVLVPRHARSASPSAPPDRTRSRPSSRASRSPGSTSLTYGLSGLFAAAARSISRRRPAPARRPSARTTSCPRSPRP